LKDKVNTVTPRPNDDGWCFVCGKENPIGLKTLWSLDADGAVRARFQPSRCHQGWIGVVHGGILAALLDEAMAQRMWREGKPAVTASLSIRYRKPAPTSGSLIAEARITSSRTSAFRLKAFVRGESGECYAEAEGTCVPLPDSAR
jgi:uncharacterized protein (TIGR00369 family)